MKKKNGKSNSAHVMRIDKVYKYDRIERDAKIRDKASRTNMMKHTPYQTDWGRNDKNRATDEES